MQTAKLTLSVDEQAIEKAKRYSRKHSTSISRIVSQYLAALPEDNERFAPTVQRLLGILPAQAEEEEYRRYLSEKYGL